MKVIIVGASARAAAFSALRVGLWPWCIDLFADRDLVACCPVQRWRGPYPDSLLDELRDVPPGPWLYTGGLENHPLLVGQLAARRELWGNEAAAIERCRNLAWLAEQTQAVGLNSPRLGSWPPGTGRWIVKPVRSGGGRGVRLWSDAEAPFTMASREWRAGCVNAPVHGQIGSLTRPAHPGSDNPGGLIVQEFIDGVPIGVVFSGSTLLGATRQLIGTDWLGGTGFMYCGSVGPVALPSTVLAKLNALARRLGLRGLFGIDGILDGERFWPVEVNPRYTASVEVLEYASGLKAMLWHRAAFDPACSLPELPSASRVVAKGIIYSRRDATFPSVGPWLTLPARMVASEPDDPMNALPHYADIPDAGTPTPAGEPVMTIFADGPDEASALFRLAKRAEEVRL